MGTKNNLTPYLARTWASQKRNCPMHLRHWAGNQDSLGTVGQCHWCYLEWLLLSLEQTDSLELCESSSDQPQIALVCFLWPLLMSYWKEEQNKNTGMKLLQLVAQKLTLDLNAGTSSFTVIGAFSCHEERWQGMVAGQVLLFKGGTHWRGCPGRQHSCRGRGNWPPGFVQFHKNVFTPTWVMNGQQEHVKRFVLACFLPWWLWCVLCTWLVETQQLSSTSAVPTFSSELRSPVHSWETSHTSFSVSFPRQVQAGFVKHKCFSTCRKVLKEYLEISLPLHLGNKRWQPRRNPAKNVNPLRLALNNTPTVSLWMWSNLYRNGQKESEK